MFEIFVDFMVMPYFMIAITVVDDRLWVMCDFKEGLMVRTIESHLLEISIFIIFDVDGIR